MLKEKSTINTLNKWNTNIWKHKKNHYILSKIKDCYKELWVKNNSLLKTEDFKKVGFTIERELSLGNLNSFFTAKSLFWNRVLVKNWEIIEYLELKWTWWISDEKFVNWKLFYTVAFTKNSAYSIIADMDLTVFKKSPNDFILCQKRDWEQIWGLFSYIRAKNISDDWEHIVISGSIPDLQNDFRKQGLVYIDNKKFCLPDNYEIIRELWLSENWEHFVWQTRWEDYWFWEARSTITDKDIDRTSKNNSSGSGLSKWSHKTKAKSILISDKWDTLEIRIPITDEKDKNFHTLKLNWIEIFSFPMLNFNKTNCKHIGILPEFENFWSLFFLGAIQNFTWYNDENTPSDNRWVYTNEEELFISSKWIIIAKWEKSDGSHYVLFKKSSEKSWHSYVNLDEIHVEIDWKNYLKSIAKI
jgi:hypothetical protein